jgi:hypothetical protein
MGAYAWLSARWCRSRGLSGWLDTHRLMRPSTLSMRSPSGKCVKNSQSKSSLRAPNLIDEDPGNGRYSLAHELAVALMPEPADGSKLLAEEFGIEYDEGAEGIDDEDAHNNETIAVDSGSSSNDQWRSQSPLLVTQQLPLTGGNANLDGPPTPQQPTIPSQDAMALLALDLECTDKFISHLRCLDIDSGSSMSQPGLEKIASDVIRRINDTARDREGQVRALLEYEREFRRIASEVGGSDVLSQLDELPHQDHSSQQADVVQPHSRRLESVEEEPSTHVFNDWETDPTPHRISDESEDVESLSPSLPTDSFSSSPSTNVLPSAANSIPQLAHLRSFTASLVTSLSTISEQAQVNGVATTEAGRKIRALKNKLGGWRIDWDNAERSRVKIEKWEAGILDGECIDGISNPHPFPSMVGRIDGRKVVEEHLQAFERALIDAGTKTRAIMAS